LPFELAAPCGRQRDLEQSPVIGRNEQLHQAGLCCFERLLTCCLARHFHHAREIRERRRDTATLDRTKQLPTGAQVKRRLTVEGPRLAKAVCCSHDLEQKSRRFDMKLVE